MLAQTGLEAAFSNIVSNVRASINLQSVQQDVAHNHTGSCEMTTFSDPGNLPNYTLQGVWWVMWLVCVEYVALWWQGARLPVLHDNIISLVHATLYEVTKLFVRGVEYGVYTWVWQHYSILPALDSSLLGLAILVVLIDLVYYWLHRANHEIMLLWAIHQVHHTSQDLTVAVGLRHSPLQRLFAWVFYLPLAVLGVPPNQMLAHSQFNTLYQCWTHTHAIRSIGPLDYIFNCPAHHRVHHGSNLYCLDKNYGGVFILWDRLFGTFQQELPDEEIIYGILTQPDSYNPLYHQVFYLKMALEKARGMSTWRERLSTLVKGPSWMPGSPWTGWDKDKPDIRGCRVYRKVKASSFTHCYVLMHFLAILTLTNLLIAPLSGTPVEVFVYSMVVVVTLGCIGVVYDDPPYTRLVEVMRCSASLLICLFLPPLVTPIILQLLTSLYVLSLTLWLFNPTSMLPHPSTKLDTSSMK
ncbi:hypothetical protein OTU49_013745 [Cherax quadricarinatus]